MHAIVELAKAKGKRAAKTRRVQYNGIENAIQIIRKVAEANPQDQIVLKLVQTIEEVARTQETKRAEAARVQTGLYWLKNGDTPNKVFFKALRAKKTMSTSVLSGAQMAQ